MARKVSVTDVNALQAYIQQMTAKKQQVESRVTELVSRAEALEEEIEQIRTLTEQQGDNWDDPQYTAMQEQVVQCVSAARQNTQDVESTAARIRSSMEHLSDSVGYATGVVRRLQDL